MYCQKCKTPLRLDGSLENLSTAALQHITGPPLPLQQPATSVPQAPQTAAKNELYQQATQDASSSSAIKQSTPRQQSDPAAMSFVLLSESQIAAPRPPPDRRKSSSSKASTPSKKSRDRPSSNSRSATPTSKASTDHLLSQRVLISDRIFEILSSRSDIDHPVCVECSDTLLKRMEARLASASKERDALSAFLQDLQADQPTEEEAAQALTDLSAAQREEAAALTELKTLENEKTDLEAELRALELESQELEKEETAFWHEHNALHAQTRLYTEQRQSAELRLRNDQRLLERLQRTNVYNDTFNISHDGLFGTINALRLGRLSYPTVEWAEINAAWGQALLLLSTVARRLEYTFVGYRLVPLGSFSRIERVESGKASVSSDGSGKSRKTEGKDAGGKTDYPLYHIPDINPLSGTFFHRPFDAGMIAFLECLRQLGAHLEKLTTPSNTKSNTASPSKQKRITAATEADQDYPTLRLPYEIKKDKINDTSIKLGSFGGDENWTKACKYALTCLKFLLAGASSVGAIGGGARYRDVGAAEGSGDGGR